MKTTFKNRKVTLSLSGQHDDDIQIDEATFDDTGESLTDDEIETLQGEMPDEIYEAWLENQRGRAEAMAESLEDR